MGRSVLSATGFPYCYFVQARAQEIERLQQDQEKQENGRAYQSMLHRKAAQLYEGDGGEREETCSREGCTIKHQRWERCRRGVAWLFAATQTRTHVDRHASQAALAVTQLVVNVGGAPAVSVLVTPKPRSGKLPLMSLKWMVKYERESCMHVRAAPRVSTVCAHICKGI